MIQDHKKRGEWVELQFLARATSHGITVSKPWGDSTAYDYVVESNRVFHRVQVKSSSCFLHNRYACQTNYYRKRARHYPPDAFDFFAIYIVPEDLWYIIPVADVPTRASLAINPRARRSRYFRYMEAWHLLRGPAAQSPPQPLPKAPPSQLGSSGAPAGPMLPDPSSVGGAQPAPAAPLPSAVG